MKNKKPFCIDCEIAMKPSFSLFKGISFPAYQCTKCRKKVLTEEQAKHMARGLDNLRLKKSYKKHPIKVGHSWAMTFPKEVAEVFELDKKSTRITLKHDINKKKIEIIVQS